MGKGAQSGHWNLFEEAIQNGILPGEGPPLEEFRKERKRERIYRRGTLSTVADSKSGRVGDSRWGWVLLFE